MPLDTVSLHTHRPRPSQGPCLDLAERQAAQQFGPQLRAALDAMPACGHPMVALMRLATDLADARFRLAPRGDTEAIPLPDEVVVGCLPTGLPMAPAERRTLAVRLASAAAGAWRLRCQIRRLGLIAF